MLGRDVDSISKLGGLCVRTRRGEGLWKSGGLSKEIGVEKLLSSCSSGSVVLESRVACRKGLSLRSCLFPVTLLF